MPKNIKEPTVTDKELSFLHFIKSTYSNTSAIYPTHTELPVGASFGLGPGV